MTPSLRIAFFLQDLRGGGAERVTVLLANAMAEAGHRVDLLLVRDTGPNRALVSPRVRIVDLARGRTWAAVAPLVAHLRRERPDGLISALTHVNVAACLAAALVGTRLVVTEHNQIRRNRDRVRSATVGAAYRAVPAAYRLAAVIVAVSDGVRDDLAAFAPGIARKIAVVPNPVVTGDLLCRAARPAGHPWLEGRRDGPVVVACGRLAPQKDFAGLLRAFARLVRVRPARLVVLGEGAERARLEALRTELGLSERVDFPGYVDNPYAFFAAADLFVLSSAWEGLPTVLIEAMACGARIVATDCPSGPREILENGRFGTLVPPGDPDALAAAMAAAMDAALDASDDAGARVVAAMRFDPAAAVRRYLDLLRAPERPTGALADSVPAAGRSTRLSGMPGAGHDT